MRSVRAYLLVTERDITMLLFLDILVLKMSLQDDVSFVVLSFRIVFSWCVLIDRYAICQYNICILK